MNQLHVLVVCISCIYYSYVVGICVCSSYPYEFYVQVVCTSCMYELYEQVNVLVICTSCMY